MAQLVSRDLSKNDPYQCLHVKVDSRDVIDANSNKGKSGYYVVSVTSISWTDGQTNVSAINNGAIINIQAPNHDERSDNKLKDEFQLSTSQGSETYNPAKAYYIALNEGVPSPSARVNPDGTFDLLDIEIQLDALYYQGIFTRFTINYSVVFTEVLENNVAGVNQVLSLKVDDNKTSDLKFVQHPISSVTNKSGIVILLLSDINVQSIYNDAMHYVPTLKIMNSGGQKTLIAHRICDESYQRSYLQRRRLFIFAANNGKMDGNSVLKNNYNLPIFANMTYDRQLNGQVQVDLSYKIQEILSQANW
jgi:hypothetical protein